MKREFTKYIKSLDSDELRDELTKLYTRFDLVRKHYQLELGHGSEKLLEKYRTQVYKAFFPTRRYTQKRNTASLKPVTELKKVAVHQEDVIDLLLYRIETMLDYTAELGHLRESFYKSLVSSFKQAVTLIESEGLQFDYRERVEKILERAKPYAWATHGELEVLFSKCFRDESRF